MLQKEFEALIGKEVSSEDFVNAYNLYMALPNMNKFDFCEIWKTSYGSFVPKLVERVEQLEQSWLNYESKLKETENKAIDAAYVLLKGAHEHKDNTMKEAAIALVGMKAVVLFDLENGYELSKSEQDYICDNLN